MHDTGPSLNGAAFEQALIRNQRLDRYMAEAEGSGLGLSVVRKSWKLTIGDCVLAQAAKPEPASWSNCPD